MVGRVPEWPTLDERKGLEGGRLIMNRDNIGLVLGIIALLLVGGALILIAVVTILKFC